MKNFKKYYCYFAALLMVVAIVLFLVCPVVGASSEDEGYTGLQAIFGYSSKVGSVSFEVLLFSVLNLVSVICALLATLVACLKKVPFKSFIVCILAVAAGVLMILAGPSTKYNEDAQSLASLFGGKIEFVTLTLGYISGIIAIFSGVSFLLVDVLLPSKKKKRHKR